MKIRFDCRDEQCPAMIEYRPKGTADEHLACPRCAREYTVHDAPRLRSGESLQKCAMCESPELFIRKNFPQKTGLLIVLVAAAISIFTLKTNIKLAYGILGASVLLDAIIYYLIGVVTVC